MTLTDFLLARIAEDEAELTEGRVEWMRGDDSSHRRDRWLQFNPDDMDVSVGYGRVLAECEAKRRIVEIATAQIRLAKDDAGGWDNWHDMAVATLQALALPYADHPDYREEWKP